MIKRKRPSKTHNPEGLIAPLRHTVFRSLWFVWLTSNICMWMNDVAAAWTMASLTQSAMLIALVQTASSLPVLLLGVPSGALADIINRKQYFFFAQMWLAVNATALTLIIVAGALNPYLLLFLTFTNGIGLAMRWPIFAAIVPEVVPRESLSPALALNAIAMNTSRIIGPLTAGAIIAAAGSEYVFILNMILSVISMVVVMRWKYQGYVSTLPAERFIGAMRVGMQYIWQSNRMKNIIFRAFLFFFQTTGLIALLPVITKEHFGGDAHTFTLLLSCLGFGAIIAGTRLPYLKKRFALGDLMNYGLIILSLATTGVVLAENLWLASALMMVCGAAWISFANSLTNSAQLTLPGWVRARGMSIYQMGLMGGSASGAAVWGALADEFGVVTSIVSSSIFGLLVVFLVRRHQIDNHPLEDLSPVCPIERPIHTPDIDLHAGPVMISIEYKTLPEKADEFKKLMAKARKSRLRQGALSWSLFEDAEHPGKFVEDYVFGTWADYLRRFDRFTAEDLKMQEERHRYHIDTHPPKIIRRVAATIQD